MRLTRFRFHKGQHQATCVKCGGWKPFNLLIWPIDETDRTRLVCKKCRDKAEAKKKRTSTVYLDTRTGLKKRQTCDTCGKPKPPRSYYVITGTLLLRNTCIACERELRQIR